MTMKRMYTVIARVWNKPDVPHNLPLSLNAMLAIFNDAIWFTSQLMTVMYGAQHYKERDHSESCFTSNITVYSPVTTIRYVPCVSLYDFCRR
jgi:hypothetical protein